jgi:hypothetical protein
MLMLKIYLNGLKVLKKLDTIAAIMIIGSPLISITIGISENNYLCKPIIHATKYPTTIPIKQEFIITIKHS